MGDVANDVSLIVQNRQRCDAFVVDNLKRCSKRFVSTDKVSPIPRGNVPT
jgi:hypothetical protein